MLYQAQHLFVFVVIQFGEDIVPFLKVPDTDNIKLRNEFKWMKTNLLENGHRLIEMMMFHS